MGEEAESAEARGPTRPLGVGQGQAAPRPGVAALCLLFDSLQVYCFGTVKIGTSVFELSNSENISCTTFLKYKNSRKQELALRHLVNRLVPENA